jgi:copper chaperone CopZ
MEISIEPRPVSMPEGVRELPLVRDGGADAGCACCAPAAAEPDERSAHDASVAADYLVSGMTCQNCVSHVTSDLTSLDGVVAVEVDLVANGVSTVRVLSDAPIDRAVIVEAVADGGYEVVSA